ncbi:MAG TPA: helix-turn-helix transcriptional regulator [Selenomonadales bacterium]|nr:helix-turn-helix transcriptional regulator [Selenomonadales bacterium]
MSKKDDSRFNPVYKDIGRKVSFYRNLRGLSQEELATKIDISTGHLAKIEAPNTNISFSLHVLLLIAEALDIDIAALFTPIDISGPHLKKRVK